MCGIAAILNASSGLDVGKLKEKISSRGPDILNVHTSVSDIQFICSVLHIQGETCCSQPILHDNNVFCWNGEVFGGLTLSENVSDTVHVSNILSTLPQDTTQAAFDKAVCEVMSKIDGPYSFIWYCGENNSIYFGRDPFGRRSLLTYIIDDEIICLSSIAGSPSDAMGKWEELSVRGIFKIDLLTRSSSCVEWPSTRLRLCREIESARFSIDNPHERFLVILKQVISQRLKVFRSTFCRKCLTNSSGCCKVGVLFSGGIDSVLLTAVLHLVMENPETPIDLINVTFYNDIKDVTPSPDRLASIAAHAELVRLFPQRAFNLVHIDVNSSERVSAEPHIKELIFPSDTHMDLNIGTAFWFASRGKGNLFQAKDDIENIYSITSAGRPLLRLGGKGFAESVGTKIENRNMECSISTLGCTMEGCRLKSKASCVFHYCKKCCLVQQVEDNCKCSAHKRSDSSEIDSVPFENASVAFEDVTNETSLGIPYESCCRVLLVGIGADEQLAGYGRHRTTFLRGGSDALQDELNMDMCRLWQRNLGRDDRCVSDNGKEAWFPYLDEQIVRFLQELPIDQICDLHLEQGHGDKKILRDAAKLIGLGNCTQLVKRAIQFGTRIAKHTNVLYHGSNRKGKGTNKI